LERYKAFLTSCGLSQHKSNNKLRDIESSLVDEGHAFSWNAEILFSFDVCGHCEAHALLIVLQNGLGGGMDAIETVPHLKDFSDEKYLSSPHLTKCPKQMTTVDTAASAS
jgi:hypothetical protein